MGPNLLKCHQKAKEVSAKEGVVQHINRYPEVDRHGDKHQFAGKHYVSDWYNGGTDPEDDTTVATWRNGKLIDDSTGYESHMSKHGIKESNEDDERDERSDAQAKDPEYTYDPKAKKKPVRYMVSGRWVEPKDVKEEVALDESHKIGDTVSFKPSQNANQTARSSLSGRIINITKDGKHVIQSDRSDIPHTVNANQIITNYRLAAMREEVELEEADQSKFEYSNSKRKFDDARLKPKDNELKPFVVTHDRGVTIRKSYGDAPDQEIENSDRTLVYGRSKDHAIDTYKNRMHKSIKPEHVIVAHNASKQDVQDHYSNEGYTPLGLQEDDNFVSEAVKKIGEYTSGENTAKVYKLSGEHNEGDPYTVKLFKSGKHYEPAQYFTNDHDDAHSTAQHMVNESTLVELSSRLVTRALRSGIKREKEAWKKGDNLTAVPLGKKVVKLASHATQHFKKESVDELSEMAIAKSGKISWIHHPGIGHAIYNGDTPTHKGYLTQEEAAKEYKKQTGEQMTESKKVPLVVEATKSGLMQYKYTVALFDEVIAEGFAVTKDAAIALGQKLADRLEESYVPTEITKANVLEIAKSLARNNK